MPKPPTVSVALPRVRPPRRRPPVIDGISFPTGAAPLATLAAVLASVGCFAPGDAAPAAEVVDSAGIRILTYDLANVDIPAYRTVGDPDLEIGQQDGAPEYAFSRIADLATTSDGAILVSDAVAREIRVFDPGGAHRGTLGRRGEGPGEFATAPTIAGLSGDTVFAFDSRTSRVSSFTLAGELLETTTLRSDEIGRPLLVLRQADGTYVTRSRWVHPDARPESHDVRLMLDSIVVERISSAGELLDTLRVMPDMEWARRMQVLDDGLFRVQQARPPYRPRTEWASDGTRLVLGWSGTFEVDLLRPGAGSRTLLRVLGVAHPARGEDIRAHQEAILREDLGDGEIDPVVRRLNLELLPDRLPAFGAILASDAGDVWVARSDFDASEGLDWLVFSPDGALRGDVRTPPGLRVRAIRGDHLIGFVLDELDVPYVRRYPLLETKDAG